MKKLFLTFVFLFSVFVVSAQFSGFGLGASVNRLDDKGLSSTTLDLTYAFSNFYIEVGANQGIVNDENVAKFAKFNVGYAFNIKDNDYLVPFFGMAYETGVDPKVNIGAYIVSYLSEKIYLMGGLGTTEKIKIGIGFTFGGSFCQGGSCLAR